MRRRMTEDLDAFLPPDLRLERAATPWPLRAMLYLLLAIVGVAIGWAAWAKVDRVVVAQGRVVNSDPLAVLQPLETAVLHALPVRVGDPVRKGQVVAELDATFAGADVGALEQELDQVEARIARLEAETDGAASASLADGEAAATERRLFEERRAVLEAREAAYAARLAAVDQEMQGVRNGLAVAKRRREVLAEVQEMRRTLHEREIGSRLALLGAESEKLALDQQIQEQTDRLATLTDQRAQVTAEQEAFRRDWSAKRAEELVETRTRRSRLAGELAKAQRRTDLVRLLAPADGIVLDRADVSVGAVIPAGRALVTIVPASSRYEAEVEIDPRDIAFVQPDDPVRVKLEAYPFQVYGTLDGTVRVIAPDAIAPPDRETDRPAPPAYRAFVALDPAAAGTDRPFDLLPGMRLAAEIRVGERSVLSYFLRPFLRTTDEAIREPS